MMTKLNNIEGLLLQCFVYFMMIPENREQITNGIEG